MLTPARHITVRPSEYYLQRLKSKKSVRVLSVLDIAKVVAEDTKTPLNLIYSPSRKREIVEKRHLIIYLARKKGIGSYAIIAKEFNQDHTTAMSAEQTIQNLIDTNKDFGNIVNRIKKKL